MGKFYEGLSEELSLYVRQCAWLNAVPEKRKGDTSKRSDVSRLAAMQKKGAEPELPPVDAPHLLEYFWEIGPTIPTTMCESPLTHGEIRAWQDNVGIDLQSWEVRLLRRLSLDYMDESVRAKKHDCPPPWKPDDFAPNLKEVAMDLEAEMDRLMGL